MGAHNAFLHSLASCFDGVDGKRMALAAGVLVLLVFAWRRVRDGLVLAVVFGSVFGPVMWSRFADAPEAASGAGDVAPVPASSAPALILA